MRQISDSTTQQKNLHLNYAGFIKILTVWLFAFAFILHFLQFSLAFLHGFYPLCHF